MSERNCRLSTIKLRLDDLSFVQKKSSPSWNSTLIAHKVIYLQGQDHLYF